MTLYTLANLSALKDELEKVENTFGFLIVIIISLLKHCFNAKFILSIVIVGIGIDGPLPTTYKI